jgi:hypothetical protein
MACSRTTTSIACLAISVAILGCGSDSGAPSSWDFSRVKSVEFTDAVPVQVTKTCARAARKTTVECPDVVPRGGVVPDRDLYGFLYPPTADSYDLTFNNGDNSGRVHWMVGSGDFGKHLDQSVWVKRGKLVELGTRKCAGHQITGYRFPPYPAGGPLGSHSAAVAAEDGREYWASVHGRYNLGASIALLLATLGAQRPLDVCR